MIKDWRLKFQDSKLEIIKEAKVKEVEEGEETETFL